MQPAAQFIRRSKYSLLPICQQSLKQSLHTFIPPSEMLQTSPNRHFTASTALLGKSKKKEKHSSGGDAASTSTSTSRDSKSSSTSPQDPHDFTALEEDIAANLQTLQTKLAHLRTSTRLDPQRVEEIRVVLDKAGSQSLKLGDVAQVIPKGGRNMVVMIGDKDHIKPVGAAIMRAELTWKPSPTNNPLELHVPIPPPTAESRAADAALASQEGEKALLGVRNARGSCHKRLRKMELEKKARPDDLRKAGKTMESIVEKATVEVKKAVDATKKAVMG